MTSATRVFGPVPSRRLGRSLGIDPVPYKTCSYDCIYCQLGHTTQLTTTRRAYVEGEVLIGEIERWIATDGRADYLTLSGSGEPTLNSDIHEVIAWCKHHTRIPVAVLTNGSLFWLEEVREAVRLADLVIPSLDAATEATFQRLNHPHPQVHLKDVVRGMAELRRTMKGKMWVEVMLVAGLNDSRDELRALREALARISPDRVQLNTVVRPPAEVGARPLDRKALQQAQTALGPDIEIVVSFSSSARLSHETEGLDSRIMEMLNRRPCTIADMAAGLGIHPHEISKHLSDLVARGLVETAALEGVTYFRLRRA
ncbi:MAG: radical SAM protein [Candidatus Zipacnadales bacterium]